MPRSTSRSKNARAAIVDAAEDLAQLRVAPHVDAHGAEEPRQAGIVVVHLVGHVEDGLDAADERRRRRRPPLLEAVVHEPLDVVVDGAVEVELRLEVVVDRAGRDAGVGGRGACSSSPRSRARRTSVRACVEDPLARVAPSRTPAGGRAARRRPPHGGCSCHRASMATARGPDADTYRSVNYGRSAMVGLADLDEFVAEARRVPRRSTPSARRRSTTTRTIVWGKGEFDVSVFHALVVRRRAGPAAPAQAWTQTKAERGYHAINWPTELGGLGSARAVRPRLRPARARVRDADRRTRRTASRPGSSRRPIRAFGTPEQQAELVPTFLAARELCCQLFSEPGAGSDLATLACRAERDGDEWVVNGQKVWSSGAQFSAVGRADRPPRPGRAEAQGPDRVRHPDGPAGHRGPPDQADERRVVVQRGVLRPTCASPTRCGSAPSATGWKVALTTLGFERDHSDSAGGGGRVGGSWRQLLGTARAMGVDRRPVDPPAADRGSYTHQRVEQFVEPPRRRPPPRRRSRPARRARSASCSGRRA